MSIINNLTARALVALHPRSGRRGEEGQATAEYGVVALVAVALALAVFSLVSGNVFDGVLGGLLESVLKRAVGLVKDK